LVEWLTSDLTVIHPTVVVELTCGTPPAPRSKSLGYLKLLERANQASLNEVLKVIERKNLYSLGCGLADITLLVSTLITPVTKHWTLGKRLASLAE
jgi:hypothetical protein